ncbi:hypothetical protein CA11_46920 [Gimesia maris]|uniref:hypothetical protein n=1 Tax=Gimesia maris TaxID=122 RepID=UPI00118A6AA6|nr:hypothetical protein [Gimesia maris]QDU16856.1 hypothetical protein CA11_46920 [Gimesia maris]
MKSNTKIDPLKIRAYRNSFVMQVHSLLWMGFSQLECSRLSDLDEPEISGLICESIAAIFDNVESPGWVNNYEIHDDPPVHDPNRQGKRRRRVDLKIISNHFRPRQHFCFEAKSMKSSKSVSAYLGKEGLGRFLDGSYSSDQPIGGMIAYIQVEDCDSWCSKITSKLDKNKHKIGRGGSWTASTIVSTLKHTYQTSHKRNRPLNNITIIHTLLDCTKPT